VNWLSSWIWNALREDWGSSPWATKADVERRKADLERRKRESALPAGHQDSPDQGEASQADGRGRPEGRGKASEITMTERRYELLQKAARGGLTIAEAAELRQLEQLRTERPGRPPAGAQTLAGEAKAAESRDGLPGRNLGR
jgi:hypothetical protein